LINHFIMFCHGVAVTPVEVQPKTCGKNSRRAPGRSAKTLNAQGHLVRTAMLARKARTSCVRALETYQISETVT
jgi:hypothetical protein